MTAAEVAPDQTHGATVPSARVSPLWLAGLCAAPALFYLFIQSLPLFSDTTSPLEDQLLSAHSICLFFSPAFLPWPIRHTRRAWSRSGANALSRAALVIFVVAAAWAGFDAARWAIGMTYQPHGHPVMLMPELR
jgi:hypothetical protein